MVKSVNDGDKKTMWAQIGMNGIGDVIVELPIKPGTKLPSAERGEWVTLNKPLRIAGVDKNTGKMLFLRFPFSDVIHTTMEQIIFLHPVQGMNLAELRKVREATYSDIEIADGQALKILDAGGFPNGRP